MTILLIPKLNQFPPGLLEGAVGIELEEGVPVFRASGAVHARIEALLVKQMNDRLSEGEEQELDCYAEIDDYLGFVNRTLRNLIRSTG